MDIVQRSCQQLGYWINPAKPGEYKKYNVGLEDRLARHKHKDEKDKIRSAIQELFPNLPPKDLKEILHHAFRKGSMRVGNADMPLIRRVQLAVSAHARHNYTDYDGLLKKVSWAEARQLAEQPTLNQLKAWRGEDFDNHETEQVLRETIVIDSESDDSSEDDSSDDSDDTATRYSNRDVSLEIVSHNTYGDDRIADAARNGTAQYHDAYITSSRRQAQYQSLSAMHSRSDVTSYQAAPHAYDRSQAAAGPVATQYHKRPGADQYMYVETTKPLPAVPRDYRSGGPPYTGTLNGADSTPYQHPLEKYDRQAINAPTNAGAHTRPIFTNTSHTTSLIDNAYSYDRAYERRIPSRHSLYDPKFPRLVRQATPDRALPSVEVASPFRAEGPPLESSQQGFRLVTDRNGQTILVNVPPEQAQTNNISYNASFASTIPTEPSKRRSWPQFAEHTEAASNPKRLRSSPRVAYHMPPQNGDMIDLTIDSPQRHGSYYDRAPLHISGHAHYPAERRDPPTGVRYQPVSASNRDLGHSPRAPVMLDGAQDRPEPRYEYALGAARQELNPKPVRATHNRPVDGPVARKVQRVAPVERNERHEQYAPVSQSRHPDDSMRSLYDEREPQQPRKAHHKRHHAGRPRYHDHDLSAVRQQDQPLDYL